MAHSTSRISILHPDYEESLPLWTQIRDCVEGQHKIHKKGTLYLPKLSEQEDNEYKKYKSRANFFNATGRTLDALLGLLFRKEPINNLNPNLSDWQNDVDGNETPLHIFEQNLSKEILTTGRVGILVDIKDDDPVIPKMITYKAENIINWFTDSKNKVIKVILHEPMLIEDNFDHDVLNIYRVLHINEDGVYQQDVYQEVVDSDNISQMQLNNSIIPTRDGEPFNFIPFFIIGWRDMDIEVDKAPLLDLSDINISHYKVSADYENVIHFLGVPQPYITGHRIDEDEEGSSLTIGSTSAWVFPEAEAKVGYLSLDGTGLEEIRKNLDKKENSMAILGARLLTTERRSTETATSARLHRIGEASILSSVSRNISRALTKIVNFISFWAMIEENNEISLNHDFEVQEIQFNDLINLVDLYQRNAITFDEMSNQLVKFDIRNPNSDLDEIRNELESSISNINNEQV